MKTANEYYKEMIALNESGIHFVKKEAYTEPFSWCAFEDQHPIVAAILCFAGMIVMAATIGGAYLYVGFFL